MKGSTEQLLKHSIIFENSNANYLPAKDASTLHKLRIIHESGISAL
jgi:hypothetical protein